MKPNCNLDTIHNQIEIRHNFEIRNQFRNQIFLDTDAQEPGHIKSRCPFLQRLQVYF